MNVGSHIETYRIVGAQGAWRVAHDDETSSDETIMAYVTKEAAFEAAVSAASNAVRAGHEVSILVPASHTGETLFGGADWRDLS